MVEINSEGLITNQKEVEEALGLFEKRGIRKDKVDIQRLLQVYKLTMPTINSTSMIQSLIATSKKGRMGINVITIER